MNQGQDSGELVQNPAEHQASGDNHVGQEGIGSGGLPILLIRSRPRTPPSDPDAAVNERIQALRDGVPYPRVRMELTNEVYIPLPGAFHDQSAELESTEVPSHPFKVGDRVKVLLPHETFRLLQIRHGGLSHELKGLIGHVGVIKLFMEKGDALVEFLGASKNFRINPLAFSNADAIQAGKTVRIITDLQKLKELQEGHGGWMEKMGSILGQIGFVMDVHLNGDLEVLVGEDSLTLNPLAVTLYDSNKTG